MTKKHNNSKQLRLLTILLFGFITIVISFFIVSAFNWKIAKEIGLEIPATSSQTENYNNDIKVKGSIPYWDQENALSSYNKNHRKIDNISLFWYYLGNDGTIQIYEYADTNKKIVTTAQRRGDVVFAVITNLPEEGTWDSKRVEETLNKSEERKKHIEDIFNMVTTNGFDGIVIDYEELKPSVRKNFTLFIKELSNRMHEEKKLVGVALHPKNGDPEYEERSGSGAQDWTELAKYADEFYIMAYGEHWDEGEAGPIASANWVEGIASHTSNLNVDMEKFYLGIPLYGYAWNLNSDETAEGLVFTDVVNTITGFETEEKWDDEYRTPYIKFQNDGDSYEAWYENARSVNEKIEIAKKYGFGGVAFWRLGGEDPEIWKNLK